MEKVRFFIEIKKLKEINHFITVPLISYVL